METQLSVASASRKLTFTLLGCLGAAACSANIHDNVINIPGATVNFTADADVSAVEPAQTVPLTLNVTNVYLIEPMAPVPAEHVADAGHVQIYLDDVATEPLLVTAQVNVAVTVPPQTKAGKHHLICRVHHHDGTPTGTKFEVEITVKVTVGGGTGGAGGSSATGGSTGTGGTTGAGGTAGTTAAGGAGGA